MVGCTAAIDLFTETIIPGFDWAVISAGQKAVTVMIIQASNLLIFMDYILIVYWSQHVSSGYALLGKTLASTNLTNFMRRKMLEKVATVSINCMCI
jgi:hypothetical protein